MKWTHDALMNDLAAHLRQNTARMIWTDMQIGPSGSQRPDVYALDKTYNPAKFAPIVYEVKVSVADFRSDVTKGKWQGYMQYASGVIFAAPVGLINKSDLPPGCGLMVRGENGWKRLKGPTLRHLETLPHVADIAGRFYFKPEAGGRLWLSPHDETPSAPCDAAPDEIDVAIAIDRLQQVVDWPIAAVERKWAGLRSFAPDRLPVFGADPHVPGFVWCAGQGGFGIQTSPAIGELLAAELGAPWPRGAIGNLDPAPFSPTRLA